MNLAPRTRKGTRSRDRILETARRIIVDEGFDALAMRDLAKRCDMQLGNLQYYFATRDALAAAVISAEAAADIAAVEAAAAAHEDPASALDAIVRSLLRRWRGEAGLIFATLGFLCLHKQVFVALRQEIYAAFYDALAAAIREVDPAATAAMVKLRVRLITAVLDGAAQQVTGGSGAFVDAISATVFTIARGINHPDGRGHRRVPPHPR